MDDKEARKRRVPRLRFPGFTDEWEQRKLGDVCISFEYGLNAAAKDFDGINKYIRITDIDDETRTFLNTNLMSPDCDLSLSENYQLQDNDIVFARTGASVGKTFIYKASDGLVYYAGFLIRAKIKKDTYPDFVFYCTLTKQYEKFIRITSQRSGQPGVNAQEYATFEFCLPSYEEQEQIGKYFRNLDNLIILYQRKLEHLKELKKGLIQKMFPKNGEKTPEIRFPGFTEAWEQRKLGELCERVSRKNKNGESDLPLTIASQYGLIDQRDFFNKVVAAKDMSNYYLLKKGEFAYNKSYSNGFDYGSIKRLNAYEQGCLSTLYICFGITSDDIESDYLECFFDTLKWYSDITMICAEGARNHGLLNVDTKAFFDEVTIEMPTSREEQKQISTYLNNLDNLITLHQRRLDHLKELKKGLLQQMFV